tara:strand:- start:760 stop:933 length:174 start_codon:yes stop_codon:yes gene_type:complete
MWISTGNAIPINRRIKKTTVIPPPPPFDNGIIAENSPYTGAAVIFIEDQNGVVLEQE